MKNVVKDENGLIRTKKRSVSYYLIWYGICVATVAIYHLVTKQFSWGKMLIMAVILGVLSVGWFFVERMSVKQEEAMARELEERRKGKKA